MHVSSVSGVNPSIQQNRTVQVSESKQRYPDNQTAGAILPEAAGTKVCCDACQTTGSKAATKPDIPQEPSKQQHTPKQMDLKEAAKTEICCFECKDTGVKTLPKSLPTQDEQIPNEASKTKRCCDFCGDTGHEAISVSDKASKDDKSTILKLITPLKSDQESQPTQRLVKNTLPTPIRPKSEETEKPIVGEKIKEAPKKEVPKETTSNKGTLTPKVDAKGEKPVTPGNKTQASTKGDSVVLDKGTKPITLSKSNDIQAPRLILSNTQDPTLRAVLSKLQFTGSTLIHAQGNAKTLPEALTKTIATLANAAPTPGDRIVTQKAMATIMQSIPSDAQSSTMTALQTLSTTAPKQLAQLTQVLQNIATSQPGNVKDIATTIAKIVQQQPNSAMTLTTVMQSVAKTHPEALSQVSTSLATVIAAAPKEAAALMTSLATVATQSPKATTVATQILSQLAIQTEKGAVSPTLEGHSSAPASQEIATHVSTVQGTNQVQGQMAKAEASTLTKVATQLTQIATAAPKEAPAIMTSIAQIPEQAPTMTETVTRILAQTAKTEAAATQKVATQLAQLVSSAPKESPKALASLASIAEQAPKATEAATKILAQISKPEPTNTPKMAGSSQIVKPLQQRGTCTIGDTSKIGEQNPKAITAATTILTNAAKSEPQSLPKIQHATFSIASAAPAKQALFSAVLPRFLNTPHKQQKP